MELKPDETVQKKTPIQRTDATRIYRREPLHVTLIRQKVISSNVTHRVDLVGGGDDGRV